MTLKPISHFIDCRAILDKALDAKVGIRITYADHGQAVYERKRLHTFRSLARRENANLYDPSDPMHDSCIYDQLILTIAKDSAVLEIARRRVILPADIQEIEE